MTSTVKTGQSWRGRIEGRIYPNGKLIAQKFHGEVTSCTESATVWDLADSVMEMMKTNIDLQIVDSIRIEILPAGSEPNQKQDQDQ